jgi:transcriptional regulator with XRE-family HTH domain
MAYSNTSTDSSATAPAATANPNTLPLSLLGEFLIARRKEVGMTQQQLADRLGMLQEAVARWERERYRTVSLERLLRVATILKANVRILVEEQPVKQSAEQAAVGLVGPQSSHAGEEERQSDSRCPRLSARLPSASSTKPALSVLYIFNL